MNVISKNIGPDSAIMRSSSGPEKKKVAELIRDKNDATARYEELRRNYDFLQSQMSFSNQLVLNAMQDKYADERVSLHSNK
jgi:hypothetical protein